MIVKAIRLDGVVKGRMQEICSGFFTGKHPCSGAGLRTQARVRTGHRSNEETKNILCSFLD